MIPQIDLEAQYNQLKPQIDAAVQRVLEHRQFILGPEVAAFEKAFAAHVQARGAVGVGSGTAALKLALLACGVGPGDKVVTVAKSFIATAEAISHVGARAVFVDVDPQTYNIDPRRVRETLQTTAGVKAIIPVHLYGQPAEMDEIMAIASEHGLKVIEDAAQAHGAEHKGRRVGSIGDLACFSFYPGKNLGACGDAGMVTGNDEEALALVSRLRNHGRTAHYEHQEVGFCDRMDGIQGAVLGVKLPHLEGWTEDRRRNAARLDQLLSEVAEVQTPYVSPLVRHVYHLYTIRAEQRDALCEHLNANGVGARKHNTTPLHRQKAYIALGHGSEDLPVTTQLANQVLSLPVYPELTEPQIDIIADQVRGFYA